MTLKRRKNKMLLNSKIQKLLKVKDTDYLTRCNENQKAPSAKKSKTEFVKIMLNKQIG